ncbi:hypothetical protein GOV11_00720 [Candidatus Woesearchaeota archaeon]|nr:hypothetical protein [Candidatus Woesearchaeota archaeon]
MSDIQHAYDYINHAREKSLSGTPNCIRIPLERFSRYYPGLEPKSYHIITAGTGVGKSKITKHLYIVETMKFLRDHPEMDVHIRWYALEESKTNFWHSMMVYLLDQTGRMRTSIRDLKSVYDTLSEDQLKTVKEVEPILERWSERISVIDDVRHPYGIFVDVEKELLKYGSWKTKRVDAGDGVMIDVRDRFVYDNPNTWFIIVVDHFSLLHPEKGGSLRDSIVKFSNEYCIQLRDKYECSVVGVQQQAQAGEERQHDNRGRLVAAKLEPSIANLADAKVTARDADVVMGLFAPSRYEIVDYRGYDINWMQDSFRSLQILKQRDGESNVRAPLFFDGKVGVFEELPQSELMNDSIYQNYQNRISR